MRQALVLRMVVVTAGAAVLVALVPPPAGAHHRPNEWCSENNTWCLNAKMRNNRRVFYLFHEGSRAIRYRLCVTAPDASRTCRRFRAETAFGLATDYIAWRDYFPHEGPGAYQVVWKRLNGERIGPRQGFHVRDG